MANNIYHKSNWGSPEKDGWGDVYFNPSATNKLYTRSDNYENSDGTDKALASKPDTQSVLMTPTAYNVGSMNSILPTNGDGNFTFDRNSTATRVNKEGLIETVAIDTPRLDYPLIDGVVQSEPALLLEPSRQNQAEYSVNLNSLLSSGTPAITANETTAPDGTNTASKITQTNTNTYQSRFKQGFTVSGSTTYTRSIFAKAAEDDLLFLQQYDGSTNYGTYFDLTNGTKTDSNASISSTIEDFGDGWYRCSVTFTTNSSATFERIQVAIAQIVNSTPTYQGDGTSGFYIWGAQLEAGSYATSYIPTSGSSVTRSAETCNGAGTSDDFNDSEGVLYAEIAALADDGTSRRISLSDASTSDTVEIILQNTGRVDYQVKSGNSFQGGGFFNLTQTEYNKIAVKYKSNDLALWVNGSERSTDNSANTPVGLSELAFDNGGGGSDFYGRTKETAVFKEALTDSELEALTSWDSFNDMAVGQEYTIR